MGFPRREFLYGIDFWEARRLLRGGERRRRDLWSAARWHAYQMMRAMPYFDMAKNGVYRPTDLIKFPWEQKRIRQEDLPPDEEMMQLRREIWPEKEGSAGG